MVAKAVVKSYLKAHPEILDEAARRAVEDFTVVGTGYMHIVVED